MPTFAAVVMAGNSPNLPDDTRSRVIRVLLLPDADGLIEESDWELIEEDAQQLHDEIAAWADQVRDEVRTERPPLPDGIVGRFREKWSPLKRIAVAAGGDWPNQVDSMALRDRAEYQLDKEDGLIHQRPAVVLLHHIHEVWADDIGFIASIDLTNALINTHPSMWGQRDRTART
jgi:3',5'-cyclic AMP phosphodiesterase CpdA